MPQRREAKEAARAPEPGCHLVADEQHPVLAAATCEHAHVVGTRDAHSSGRLHQWLDHDRGQTLGVGGDQAAGLLGPARVA